MKYVEILEQIQKEGSQPLPVFMPFRDTKQGYQSSGYVTIPNTLPFDYLDEIYKTLDLKPIHSITYEGYAWMTESGELRKSRFDKHPLAKSVTEPDEIQALKEIKEKYVTRIFGFDDDHIEPIELPGYAGAEYLCQQLQMLDATTKGI